MKITRKLLESITPDDIIKIEAYKTLLAQAEADVSAINKAYLFHIGEKRLTVWNDGNNAEYLTHDGLWQARYLHQSYNVQVTVDDVFSVYKSEADSEGYFREFARKARAALGGGENG